MRLFQKWGVAGMILFSWWSMSTAHAQCTLICKSGIVELGLNNIDPFCTRQVLIAELLDPANSCLNPLSLSIQTSGGAPVPGNLLSAANLYDILTATISFNGNPPQSCQVTIRVVQLIVCPPPVEIQAQAQACDVILTLESLDTTQACKPPNFSSIQVTAPFGNGLGPHTVPVGTHTVQYKAFTPFGDSVACTTTVTVQNQSPPTVTCQNLSPGLQPNGQLSLPVAAFIQSESDLCGIVLREVRRIAPSPSAYGPNALFDCADVGQAVTVRVRVTNASGLQDSCEATVFIVDKTKPSPLECPKDSIISCDVFDFANMEIYGNATFTDNCGLSGNDTVLVSDLRDKCGVGNILRTFIVADLSGNTASCLQTLTIINSMPLTEDLIQWPEDYIAEGCFHSSSVHPDSLPPPHNRPVVDGSVCSIIAVGYKDETLIVNNPGCFKIFRTWTVVDCCVHDPQNPSSGGVFTHTQMIKVVDNDAPVIDCPPFLSASVGSNCTVIFANLPDITAEDCSNNVKITNNSPFSISKGANASGNYPLGETPVTFTASDGCGNFSFCHTKVVVSDFAPPTPQCIHGLTTDLGLCDGMVVVKINAEFFNQKSFDNCSTKDQLVFSFSSDTSFNMIVFTCDDRDTNWVEMWVTDQAGNQAFCTTYIIVQDNFNLCPGNKKSNISGTLNNPGGKAKSNIKLLLSGNASLEQISDKNGQFSFKELDSGANYNLSGFDASYPLEGVSTYDLLLIQKHILGIKPIPDFQKLVAADANQSGNISIGDIILLRKWILNPTPDVSPLKSWRVIQPNIPMNTPSPLESPMLDVIPFAPLDGSVDNLQLTAIKVGDVSGDVNLWSGQEADTRSVQTPVILKGADMTYHPGDHVTMILSAGPVDNLQSMQMELNWNATDLKYEGIRLINGPVKMESSNFGIRDVEAGQLRFSWTDIYGANLPVQIPIFEVTFSALTQGRLSDHIRIDHRNFKAEAIVMTQLEEWEQEAAIQLHWDAPLETSANAFVLYQNKPNPFSDLTMIGFSLPEVADVIMTLYTPGGQIITQFRGKYPPGYHEMTVPGDILPVDGVIFYRMEGPGFSETKRMIRQ